MYSRDLVWNVWFILPLLRPWRVSFDSGHESNILVRVNSALRGSTFEREFHVDITCASYARALCSQVGRSVDAKADYVCIYNTFAAPNDGA